MKVYVIPRKGKKYLMLRWIDPKTGKPRERSSKTTRRREAERLAERLSREIEEGFHTKAVSWSVFRTRYEREHLSQLAGNTLGQWTTTANHLEALENPQTLGAVDSAMVSRFQAGLTGRGLRPASVAAYLGHLRVALRWAKRLGLIPEVPFVEMPKRARGASKFARSRAIVGEELDRVLWAAEAERPRDFNRWQDFLRGLYHSGLRVGELLILSWHPQAALWIDPSGAYPLIRVTTEGEKAHQDRWQPVTPEFWGLVKHKAPRGRVFPLDSLATGKPLRIKTVVRIISRIGRRAGVITDPASGKCATSHDIGRRALGTRLASRLTPQEHAKWMRHASINTTMRYYYQPEAIALSRRIWESRSPGL